MPFTLNDFDYVLPQDLIAQHPPRVRSASRLLRLAGQELEDLAFTGLPGLLRPGDVLVFNDTRVIKARLHGAKATGGKIEVLVERVLGDHEALAQIRASKPPRRGTRLILHPDIAAEVLGREDDLYHLRFETESPVAGATTDASNTLFNLLERHGDIPLPPYVTHPPNAEDEARYQTVYAKSPGAVAAPTAGLHFDADMLAKLSGRGIELAWVTLHVGAGTFQPVRENEVEKHRMHAEWYSIPEATRLAIRRARAAGGRVIAVGTTSMRALESAAITDDSGALDLRAGEADTRLFILPGYSFKVVDRLITNFHLPKSTLLMLVSAFGGIEVIRRAYQHAIEKRYRFFSYGDAMLIDRMRA